MVAPRAWGRQLTARLDARPGSDGLIAKSVFCAESMPTPSIFVQASQQAWILLYMWGKAARCTAARSAVPQELTLPIIYSPSVRVTKTTITNIHLGKKNVSRSIIRQPRPTPTWSSRSLAIESCRPHPLRAKAGMLPHTGPVFTIPAAHHLMIAAPVCSRPRSQLRNCGTAWRAPVGLIEQLGVVAFKGKGE